MKIGRVVGRTWASAKHETLDARKILLVRPLDAHGEEEKTAAYLALDTVDAGVGDAVVVLDEGGGAGQVLELDDPPIRTVIVGVIDEIERSDS